MAQLVVAAAGAAIGGATLGTGVVALGMTGTAIGWMAGSLIGSMFAKGPDGPKIEDGKFSSSIYGQPIPLNYGTMRHATQIAWWSGLIVRTEEVGGKGGGGADIERARMNLLLAVCEGPQAGVLRIWANGRLIATWNGTTYELDKDVLPAGEVRAYLGTEDQMPDPTYEEVVGAENAVPYRGTVMVAIDGLEGEQFGNRPPNIECEVTSAVTVQDGCAIDPITLIEPEAALFTGPDLPGHAATAYDPLTRRFFVVGGQNVYVYQVGQGTLTPTHLLPLAIGPITGIGLNADTRKLWVLTGEIDPGASRMPVSAIIDLDSMVADLSWVKRMLYIGESGGCEPGGGDCCPALQFNWYAGNPSSGNEEGGTGAVHGAMLHFDPDTGGAWWSWASSAVFVHTSYLIAPGIGTFKEVRPWPICEAVLTSGNGYVYASQANGQSQQSDVIYIPQGGPWQGQLNFRIGFDGTLQLITPGSAATIDTLPGGYQIRSFAWSPSRRKLYIVGPDVHVIDLDLTTGDPLLVTPLDVSGSYVGMDPGGAVWSEFHDALLVVRSGTIVNLDIRLIDPETDEIIAGPCQYGDDVWPDPGLVRGLREVGNGWFAGFVDGINQLVMLQAPGATALGGPTTLQTIVEDVSLRAGLPADNLDATAGTDVIAGFKVARQMSAKAVIESLRPGYFFDMPEVGTKLVLTKRGAAPVAAIDSGELGAAIFQVSRDEPVPAYEIEHVEAQEIPRRMELSFVDFSADYDPGVQVAERQVGESRSPAQIEVPAVLSPAEAERMAWGNLLLAHSSSSSIRLALSHAYDALSPSDAIEIPHASGDTIRVRIERITRARPLIEIEGMLEDASVYEQFMGGVIRYQGPGPTGGAIRADTILHLLDIPPLRDADNRPLFYGAVSRAFSDGYWYGAAVYKSLDGSSYSVVYSTSAEAVIGELTAVLPGWTRGNRWDRQSRIRVRLRHGSLSSASELAVLNGANACVVGNEVIQFANATLVGDREWELDTLLRHRLGTEWAAVAKSPGARFVLLTESALRVAEYPISDAGVPRQWKGVTSGQAVADAAAQTVTAIGNSVKPLAPVHIEGERDMSGNLSVSWIRRARLNAGWQDGFDVPLDEPSESYQVFVFTDGTRSALARVDNVSSPAWAYSAADQATDFGSPQDEIHLSIYQVTPAYNALGHAAEATV